MCLMKYSHEQVSADFQILQTYTSSFLTYLKKIQTNRGHLIGAHIFAIGDLKKLHHELGYKEIKSVMLLLIL